MFTSLPPLLSLSIGWLYFGNRQTASHPFTPEIYTAIQRCVDVWFDAFHYSN